MSVAGRQAIDALRKVTATFEGSEERQGQIDMSHSIAESLAAGRSIIVQAGTGTGKSLGYLVPAILAGKRTVVATATKALQDQLARQDLPLLQRHLGVDFTWAVVKGRSNYVCAQRLAEHADKDGQLEFDEMGDRLKEEIVRIREWAARTPTGDFEEFDELPSPRAREALSVGSEQCPGRNKCPNGANCFAERARESAQAADVIVVNIHLYGNHIASGGNILPEHEVVIFDEAHQLESVLSDTVGQNLTSGRISSFASAVRQVIADPTITNRIESRAMQFGADLVPFRGQRLSSPLPEPIQRPLAEIRIEINSLIGMLRDLKTDNDAVQQKSLRAQTQGTRLAESIDVALGQFEGYVAYVEDREDRPALRISPLHVGEVLQTNVWTNHQAVLTSATIPAAMPDRVGLALDGTEVVQVDSPFDYEKNSLLYCPKRGPEPKERAFPGFVHDELEALIRAAGGRTLGLFTAKNAMRAAVEAMRERLPGIDILTLDDMPRHVMIERFMRDETACIFASASFFQGVDLPGRTLSLVVIDKIPFPVPSDPLLSARREAVGAKAFQMIDIPIAATALAQAAGRLIRTADDKGVVAVLDPRLATARYAWTLINTLPPMSRTADREVVEDFLRDITR